MRLKIAALIFAALALAACETPLDDKGGAVGSGSVSGGIASRSLSGAPSPGSQADLAVSVGDRVFFGFDKYDLSADARTTLEKQAAWLESNSGITVTIEGHADERGTREYNLALGERRSNSMRDYLVALGINANRVKTISYGKERPVDPASGDEAWRKNRRGVLVVD